MPPKVKTDETVQVFFGVGGPNCLSPFHAIGEIFDRAYHLGPLRSGMTGAEHLQPAPNIMMS